jgi:hypothetical protein
MKQKRPSSRDNCQEDTSDPENVKFPPDCSCVVSQSFTDSMSALFIRTIFESSKPMNNTDDNGVLVLGTMEVTVIDCGAKYSGCTIGIGGPLLGCFFRKI